MIDVETHMARGGIKREGDYPYPGVDVGGLGGEQVENGGDDIASDLMSLAGDTEGDSRNDVFRQGEVQRRGVAGPHGSAAEDSGQIAMLMLKAARRDGHLPDGSHGTQELMKLELTNFDGQMEGHGDSRGGDACRGDGDVDQRHPPPKRFRWSTIDAAPAALPYEQREGSAGASSSTDPWRGAQPSSGGIATGTEAPLATVEDIDMSRLGTANHSQWAHGHRLWITGPMIWCQACGCFAGRRCGAAMVRPCSGAPLGNNRRRYIRRLREGRHPISNKPLVDKKPGLAS